jgi:Bacterial protein of unknown function (DUF839)
VGRHLRHRSQLRRRYEKNHGYVFEVLTAESKRQLPKPIKAFGRFEHEALAVEPNLKHVYLSEDASGPNGLFYRWTATSGPRLGLGLPNSLSDTAGRLEAMRIRLDDGSILPDVAYLTSAQISRPFKVTWVEFERVADLLRVHRPDVLAGRRDPVRQHPGPRDHAGHHRPVAEVPGLNHRTTVDPAGRPHRAVR